MLKSVRRPTKIGFLCLSLALLGFGCAPVDDGSDVAQPEFGSADSLNSVISQGRIEFGEAVEGQFGEDVTFYGYRFSALAGGEITADITQRGSSRSLDTTLFLFGQESTGNWKRLAFDNDSGWGALSRIEDHTVGDHRFFTLVVGTANGVGRGSYRLELRCNNGACLDDSEVVFDECTDDIYDLFDECVVNELDNADFGWDDPAEEWSIDYCVNDAGALELRNDICGELDVTSPGYCRATEANIRSVAPACEARLNDEYNVFPSIPLGRLDFPASIQELADDLLDQSEDHSSYSIDGYTSPPGATTTAVGQSIAADQEASRHFSVGSEQSRAQYLASSTATPEIAEILEAEYGTSYSVIDVSASFAPAAGAEQWINIEVFHFTEANVVFAYGVVSGD